MDFKYLIEGVLRVQSFTLVWLHTIKKSPVLHLMSKVFSLLVRVSLPLEEV